MIARMRVDRIESAKEEPRPHACQMRADEKRTGQDGYQVAEYIFDRMTIDARNCNGRRPFVMNLVNALVQERRVKQPQNR